jgi:hypothetical protein
METWVWNLVMPSNLVPCLSFYKLHFIHNINKKVLPPCLILQTFFILLQILHWAETLVFQRVCNWENFINEKKTPSSMWDFAFRLVEREWKQIISWLVRHGTSYFDDVRRHQLHHYCHFQYRKWCDLLTRISRREKFSWPCFQAEKPDTHNNWQRESTFLLMSAGSVRCWFLLKSVQLSSCSLPLNP